MPRLRGGLSLYWIVVPLKLILDLTALHIHVRLLEAVRSYYMSNNLVHISIKMLVKAG